MKKLLVSALALICSCAYGQVRNYVITTDLLAWYPFTGNGIDSSGNGLDGTVSATTTADRFGVSNSAYLFDGSSSYITAAPTSAIDTRTSTGFSYSLWFQYNDNTGQPQNILQCRDNTDRAISFLHKDTTQWNVGLSRSADSSFLGIYSSAILSKTRWHHIVLTSDFSAVGKNVSTLYIDGISEIVDTTIIFKPLLANIEIGRWYSADWGHGWHFNGKIDDIGIWKRALTPCEVTELNLAKLITITRNPNDDTALLGGTAMFSISDTGGSATYQWQFNTGFGYANLTNGGAFSGVNTKVLTISPVSSAMNGAQIRCIRIQGYCQDTSGVARLSLNTTGVENSVLESAVEVYPNPALDKVNIASSMPIIKVKIFDMVGACVVHEQSEVGITSIDLGSFPSGVYIIQLNDHFHKRLVKE